MTPAAQSGPRRRAPTLLALRAALALGVLTMSPWLEGCGCLRDLPPLEWHGERVSFGTDLVDEVCQGTLAMLDRGVVQIEAALDLPASGEKIAVWAVSDEILVDMCDAFVGGCASRSRAVLGSSLYHYYLHELVHARVGQFMDHGKPLFGEGIAEAIAGPSGSCLGDEECASAELAQLMGATDSSGGDFVGYRAGGDLVHGMLSQYGSDDVLAFLAEVASDTPMSQIRSRYATRFGADIDEDFKRFRRRPVDEFTPMQVGCTAPEAPRTGPDGGVILQAAMDCASPRVSNDFESAASGDGAPRGLVEWTFEVTPEQAGAFVLGGGGVEENALSVQRCGPSDFRGWHLADQGPWMYASYLPPKQADAVLLLGPGLYRAKWRRALDPGATLDVVFAPPCTFEAQNCPEGQQCTIWNVCAEQVAQPAAIGEPCEEVDGGPRACEAGARCLGGVCTAECDATRPCPAGQACARQRVCGPSCDLLGDQCAPGFSCLPSGDAELTAAGRGQCVAAGARALLEPCRRSESDCGEGLSCEYVIACPGDGDGCCVPLCDPDAADPGCPEEEPYCDRLDIGPVGVCRPYTGQGLGQE